MSNQRKAERKAEREELERQGREAYRQGKSRVPPMGMFATDVAHWQYGYDQACDAAVERETEQKERAFEDEVREFMSSLRAAVRGAPGTNASQYWTEATEALVDLLRKCRGD